MSADANGLASFVPRRVIERLAEEGHGDPQPARGRFFTALLFADIVGFTPIAQRLSSLGPDGVERLSQLLNDYFTHAVDLILRHGGDIVFFSGDGLLVQWPSKDEHSSAATRAAVRCAEWLRFELADFSGDEGIRLSLKLAVASGAVADFHVGSRARWAYFVAGPALDSLLSTMDQVASGEILLAKDIHGDLDPRLPLETLPSGALRLAARQLGSLDDVGDVIEPLAHVSEEYVGRYAAPVVRARLAARQDDWLVDLRSVSIIFLGIRDVSFDGDDALGRIQRVVEVVQRVLGDLEGAFQNLLVDDKGTVIVAAFGLPPFAHEDDAARAARAALLARDVLSTLGILFGIGVTRGRVLCGPLGGARRREYTMIGDVVNLCARLMATARAGEVLCDRATVRAAADALEFEALPAILVKGHSGTVPVFHPLWTVEKRSTRGDLGTLVGRHHERRRLAQHVDELLTSGRGGRLSIEGEAGVGKSRLLHGVRQDASDRGIRILAADADSIEQRTPYFAWRAVFVELLGDDPTRSRGERLEYLTAVLSPDEQLLRLAPLLSPLLSLDVPDNDITAQMTGEVRADNTSELLLGVLARRLEGPALLVIEDLHWLDSASSGLLRELCDRLPSLLVVASTRPPESADPSGGLAALLREGDFDRIVLPPFDLEETRALVRASLAVDDVPTAIAEAIRAKAGGNPFFTEELALAMRESGALVTERGGLRLRDVVDAPLPDTLQGVVTSRIDRLLSSEQLTVKVASVIGRTFAFTVLRDVHPVEDRGVLLRHDVDALERTDITRLLNPEPDLEWIFKHIVTQEAAYALLPYAQRRQLHRAVAKWVEGQHVADLDPVLPLLAHHWSRAESHPEAIGYLERAAEQSLRSGGYPEAIRFLNQAEEIADRTDARVEELRRLRWARQLGDAHLRMGDAVGSQPHLERVLEGLGRPVPKGAAAQGRRVLREVAIQFAQRLWPSRFSGSARDSARATEESLANEHLAQVSFFTDQMVLGLGCIFRSINVGERVGPSPLLARSLSLVSTTWGILGLQRIATYYARLGREMDARYGNLADRTLAHVHFVLRLGSLARWSEALGFADAGLAMAVEIGDQRRWRDHQCLIAICAEHQGDLDRAGRALVSVMEALEREDEPQLHCWTLCGFGEIAARRGELDKAVEYGEAARGLLDACSVSERIWVHGNRAHAYLHLRASDEALGAAREALAAMRSTPPMRFAALEGYAGATETLVAHLQDHRSERRARREARQALARLAAFARSFPLARPRLALLRGRYAVARGRLRQGRHQLSCGLALARLCRMPYDEVLALEALARVAEPGQRDRAALLAESARLWEQLGAPQRAAAARADVRTSADAG